MNTTVQTISAPTIKRLTILRFRGIEKLIWSPDPGVNVILGGGDVGKSTILDAIALLFSANNPANISDVDFWRRETELGFEIEAVIAVPPGSGINNQSRQSWPWHWNGTEPTVPNMDGEPGDVTDPVYVVKVHVNSDFEVAFELVQPNEEVEHFGSAVRRSVGLVRLGGDDRNDRDLRLVQGSALDRLLSDKTLRARLSAILAERDVGEQLKDDGKAKLRQLDESFERQTLPSHLALGLTGGQGFSIGALIGLTAKKDNVQLPVASWGAGTRRLASLEIAASCQGDCPITLVDEIERGLEPYRQRVLISRLQADPSQVFITTHSATAIGAAHQASLWYLDAKGRKFEAFIEDPDGERTGQRLRTLAERLDIADKSFTAIKAAAPNLRALIIETACGRVPPEKANASEPEKKALKSHAKVWFKSYDGGQELMDKMFALQVWPSLKPLLMPFVNAVRSVEGLPELDDLP